MKMVLYSIRFVLTWMVIIILGAEVHGAFGFGKSESVILEDVSVLTLHHGKMTAGRRSSPVPQLKCIGGSAAKAFTPQVVQCYNRGSDGYDVQWECKSDMDNAYRFGQIEVTCEGYNYADDDHVLRGSCGLEYTLEYTKEGMQSKGAHHNSYSNDHDTLYDNYSKNHKSGKADWVFLAIVGVLIYILYRTCIAGSNNESSDQTGTDDGHPGGPRGTGSGFWGGGGGGGGNPPPPRFRGDSYPSNSCGGTSQGSAWGQTRRPGGGGGGIGGGGFWTGAAAGGLLGYLFGGNRNRGYGGYGGYGGYTRPRTGFSTPRFSSGWGGGGGGGGFSGFGGGSTGTRTASGFGGTRRR